MTREEEARYVAEREAAQRRKIQLSMARRKGELPASTPRDRALMDPDPQQSARGFDPRRW